MENRLFEVKVFDAKGRLKRIIPPDKLKIRHWKIHEKVTALYRKGANMDYIFGRPNTDERFKNEPKD